MDTPQKNPHTASRTAAACRTPQASSLSTPPTTTTAANKARRNQVGTSAGQAQGFSPRHRKTHAALPSTTRDAPQYRVPSQLAANRIGNQARFQRQ